MVRLLARCPHSGDILDTGMKWVKALPLGERRFPVFCLRCAVIHDLTTYPEEGWQDGMPNGDGRPTEDGRPGMGSPEPLAT